MVLSRNQALKIPVRVKTPRSKLLIASAVGVVGLFLFFVLNLFGEMKEWKSLEYTAITSGISSSSPQKVAPPVFQVTHLKTPEAVKAIYMTSWVAGTRARRAELVKLIDETELNAVIIDIKDYTGRIAFAVDDEEIMKSGAVEERVRDIKEFIGTLHGKGIYVIGRISVFQDNFLTKKRPDLAVHRKSDGAVWVDRKGIAWLEAASTEVWDYTIRLSRASYAVGFDELNFDYIRFPSDGNMSDIQYKLFDPKIETRADVMRRFFAYLDSNLNDLEIPISADLFGLTTTSLDDLGIGQMLLEAAPYFDYIAPMVYPSHFASGFLNFKNPATEPYAVVKHSMSEASRRLTLALATSTATSTPQKLRPWLQDFNLGATYTAEMVRAQIQATYDAGLTSWMLWNPSNRYMRGALLPEDVEDVVPVRQSP